MLTLLCINCILVAMFIVILYFYALESAVRPLGERRYTKQPLLLLLLTQLRVNG